MTTGALLDTKIDQARYEKLDATVKRGAQTFIEVGQALMEIKTAKLWRIEFDTWEAYCMDRLSYTPRRIDQIIAASITANELTDAGLPAPKNENQIRPISGHNTDSVSAWRDATTVYGDSPSGQQVKAVVDRREAAGNDPDPEPDPDEIIRRQVYGAGYSLISQRMDQGVYTPRQALTICDALASALPVVRGDMLRLGMVEPTLIREMNRLKKRGSETYDEIIASGYLQFEDEAIPASEASPAQLRALLDWKSAEHRRRALAEKDAAQKVEPQALTVWTGPDDKTLSKNIRALESALGRDRLRRLAEEILKEVER